MTSEVSRPSPTATSTPSPAASPAAPPTATAPATPVPSPEATGTLAPSPTPTKGAGAATGTPSPSPTATEEAAAGPVIHFFRANVEEADPGDTIVLEWESSGATQAVLYAILPSGQLPASGWEVEPTGVYTYQIPIDARNQSEFFLYVYDAADRGAGANLVAKLRCPVPWFFAPAPDTCASEPIRSSAAEQHFEHGTMIWVGAQDAIYVLYDDDQFSPKWDMFTDTWDASKPDRDPALVPPPGRYQPVRGFGLVWREQPMVRERLGWAVDQETGFNTVVQSTTLFKYNSIYIRALDGKVWHLGPERSSWEKISVVER